MGVSINGVPNSWMVYFREIPFYKWMMTKGPPILGNPHMFYPCLSMVNQWRGQGLRPLTALQRPLAKTTYRCVPRHANHFRWDTHYRSSWDIWIHLNTIAVYSYTMWGPQSIAFSWASHNSNVTRGWTTWIGQKTPAVIRISHIRKRVNGQLYRQKLTVCYGKSQASLGKPSIAAIAMGNGWKLPTCRW
jgi:hypothetical protein